MAPRTSSTFAKRQKEQARQEKQLAKQQRRLQRKLEKRESPPGSGAGDFGASEEAASPSQPLSAVSVPAAAAAPTEREHQ